MVSASMQARMTFYQMLQMGVADLKQRAREAGDRRERARALAALVVRDVLVVLFAVVYVTLFTTLFGPVSSAVAVVTFVLLIGLRFVAFNYRPADNLKVLAALSAIFAFIPLLAAEAGPLQRLAINLVGLGAVMELAVDDPRMGNGGMYGFAYCFATGSLYGQQLTGAQSLSWIAAALLGFSLCGAVYWKNRAASCSERRMGAALRERRRLGPEGVYRLRVVLGVSFALFVGDLLGMTRLMWVGLAASSMLTPYGRRVVDRLGIRVLFVALGTILFCVAYEIVAPAYRGLIAIAAGLGVGLCATYRWSQVFNTLGAMTLGVTYYGLGAASFARVSDNLAGAVLALLVSAVFAFLASLVKPYGQRTAQRALHNRIQ